MTPEEIYLKLYNTPATNPWDEFLKGMREWLRLRGDCHECDVRGDIWETHCWVCGEWYSARSAG